MGRKKKRIRLMARHKKSASVDTPLHVPEMKKDPVVEELQPESTKLPTLKKAVSKSKKAPKSGKKK